MDHRGDLRRKADEPVTLTILGKDERQVPARIINFSGRGLGLIAWQPIPAGTAVRVQFRDTILLGEAICCSPGWHTWGVGLKLEHALYSVSELERLAREILGESSRQRQRTDPVKHRHYQHNQ